MPFIVALFLATVVWFIIQILRIFLTARRHTRNFFGQFTSAAPNGAAPGQQRKNGWSKPYTSKAKKIDSSTGEYVEFEEIESTSSTQSASPGQSGSEYCTKQQRTESQITDVEWEDI